MPSDFYNKDSLNALEAITLAQRIAFAPMIFQAAVCLRDFGILAHLDAAKKTGLTLLEIVDQGSLSEYSVSVLLDMGLSCSIVYQQDARFYLAKTGHFLLHDEMTRINMDFTRDICYDGLSHLKASLISNTPQGLKSLGNFEHFYRHLKDLTPTQQKSWFEYDHFYSDGAFDAALNVVLAESPAHIYDIGGNTGKFSMACCQKSADVHVTILDLPEQVGLATENIVAAGLSDRIDTHALNILTTKDLPNAADLYWMSQFLDCFSGEEIVRILSLIKATKAPTAKVCILEIFWDQQQFEAAAFSLNASSLYFTAIANGNSRFYEAEVFKSYIEAAGLSIVKEVRGIGPYHTLLMCE
ncbi:SAM-dependent methyltransferase [Wohlfahrtiimonas chitiniclastica]|uniref:methyltransferase n=1 Tax=Wohlfahrtiimonas chitiniclastica TaxID=400946 RepID=UPI001BCD6834|nr:SAM-dependent methyltransferase [Wohlfahrtiimonas chitiniclastica]MBS7826374.1 SAM-dependent methyltransferase [Wohlfahrtiimonas chitiniclastica]